MWPFTKRECKHVWYPVAVFHYNDTSFARGGKGFPSTTVTSRCLKCGAVSSKGHYGVGYLKLSDLQQIPAQFSQPHNKT